MDLCEPRTATIIAEFDDARAEKLKKVELPQHRFSLVFHKTQIIDKESELSKENMGYRTFKRVKSVHRYKKPTSEIYLHISSTARALNA